MQYQNIGVGVLWSRSCRLLYLPVGLEHSPDQRELCKRNYVNNPSLVKFEIFFLAFFFFRGKKLPGLYCYCQNREYHRIVLYREYFTGSSIIFTQIFEKLCKRSFKIYFTVLHGLSIVTNQILFFLFLCEVGRFELKFWDSRPLEANSGYSMIL